MRSLVLMLVTHGDETDALEGFINDTRHLTAPDAGIGVIDYAVRVDVPECFELEGGQIPSVEDIQAELVGDPWRVATRAERRENPTGGWAGEPGSLHERTGLAYNRESYFR